MDNLKEIPSKFILIGLFLSCCAFFFHHPGTPGMFMDGALYSKVAQNAAEQGRWFIPSFDYWMGKKFFEHPPFFFMFHGLLMKVFGVSWVTARMANFLVATTLVFSLFFLVRKLKSQNFAMLTCFVLFLTLPFLKKVRFPNMDIALTLFSTLSLLFYYQTKRILHESKYWLLSGIFFGFAFLMKGHPAFIIPGVIFFHLIVTKKIRKLSSGSPWVGFLSGIFIFLLWPALLFIFGELDGFRTWFENQFLKTVLESRNNKVEFFFYFKFLLKYCAPWFLMTIYSTYKTTKEKEWNSLEGLAVVWFWTILLGMSFVGWKLSHYIIPLYPAMAILSASCILGLFSKYEKRIVLSLSTLLISASLVLFFLPSAGKVRRHKNVFDLHSKLEALGRNPKKWIVMNNAAEYFDFASNATFGNDVEIYPLGENETLKFIKSQKGAWLIYGRSSDIQRLFVNGLEEENVVFIKEIESTSNIAITNRTDI